MSEGLPHHQHISGVSTQNHSQAFVGSARDVHFAGSTSAEDASDRAASACRHALFLTDPHVDRESLISAKGTRVVGTCKWITHNASYRAWLDGNSDSDTRLLWILGGPGKGKTMLSIFLTEELERHTASIDNAELLFFFCSAQDERRNTAVAVLRGLVHQIVVKRPQLIKHALPSFETPEKTQQTLSSLEALWIIFSKLIADNELGTMFCVLDGLDECEESTLKELLPKLGLLVGGTSSSIKGAFKLAIVSRDIPGLQGRTRVRLDPDNDEKVASDIRLFVSTRVQELSRIEGFNNNFNTAVQTALLKRAEGTFLWVGFAMYELLQKQTRIEIWEALEDLPSGLPAIYSRMLLRIPAKRRDVSRTILRWVTMAARPLQLQELAAVVGVQATPQMTVEEVVRDNVTLCGPLLKVQEQEVSLVHQSARDYLQRKERDSDAVLEAFRIIVESSHLELAQKCLDCIAQSSLQQRVINLDAKLDCQESLLLRYATLYWPEHAKGCSALNAELLYTLKQFLCTKHTLRRHWWVAYRKKKLLSLPQTIPLLHMLCYLGFVPLVQTEVAWESLKPRFLKRINRKDSNGNTALHVATGARNQMVVQVLIDNGAEVNARNKYKKTALHWAAEEGYEEMVRLLVGKGADVNAKDNFGGTALHLATWKMNVGIVQLLVDGGADVNAMDSFGRTVLHSAVEPWRVSEAVLRILLNKGAVVNTRESDGSMALHWAAEAGNKAVVQLLVDSGAAVNAKDNSGRTALHWAASAVEKAVVWLLLDKGADIKAKTNDGQTVLHEAVSALGGDLRGNEVVVRLLIFRGADIKAKDKDGKTARDLAVEENNKAVLKLLKKEEQALNLRRTSTGRQLLKQRAKGLAL